MAETIQYKCPCCGGRLEFDSGLQKMKCPYCDTTFDVETLEGYDDALKQDAKDDMHWDAAQQPWDDVQMGVYTCKSCGGELVCDENTAATACPFCGNPIVLTGRLSGDLKPDYVIPFKLDKKAAEAALRNHMKGKRLLPNLFRSENRISEVKGVHGVQRDRGVLRPDRRGVKIVGRAGPRLPAARARGAIAEEFSHVHILFQHLAHRQRTGEMLHAHAVFSLFHGFLPHFSDS